MKIVHLVAGAGGMYCGSCLLGHTLAAALRRRGEDALLVPLYLPLRTDEPDVSLPRIFFGGINVFLQEHSALFRHTPWFLDRLLDRPALLRRVARKGAAVRPERLGRMTVSMLRGETGRQRKELAKLIGWLGREIRPDVVHLNNALLLGVAREIRRQLGAAVVCSLAGEDVFIGRLPDPHQFEVRRLLQERAAEVDALVAMNRYYAGRMAEYLSLPRERFDVVPPGIVLEGYQSRSAAGPAAESGQDARAPEQLTIGFLARICPEKGLHVLVDALRALAGDPMLPMVRVLAVGYLAPGDRGYLDEIVQQVEKSGLTGRFAYLGEVDRTAKIAFLQSIDIFCLPTVAPESKGLPVLEAWAAGVPAVLPDSGAFPELIAGTGGGITYEAGRLESLVAALKRMLLDRGLVETCGRQARQAVRDRYSADAMARGMCEIYRRVARSV
jgi:glycosyltransferase involved in cell wall biosynthesis